MNTVLSQGNFSKAYYFSMKGKESNHKVLHLSFSLYIRAQILQICDLLQLVVLNNIDAALKVLN